MPSKSKKYSRKRNYRKRRHSRRMQRKSRSRNAYNRRRRTMFGGALEGKYKVTADTPEASQQNSENKSVLDLLKSMGYLEDSPNNEYVSTEKFNNDFELDGNSKNVELSGVLYTIIVTPNDGNYNVNVKTMTDGVEKDNGNVTFTKVPA